MMRWIAAFALLAVPASSAQDTWLIVALRFDAKGTLYAADARGSIHAIETVDKAAKAEKVVIADLGDALAKAMKANAGDVFVNAMAVHPVSHAVYIAASRVRGAATTLFRVNDKGELEALAAKNLKLKSVAMPKGVQPLDLVVGPKGLIVSSFMRDKQFLARLHTVALPLADGAAPGTAESELYHTSHEAWETEAPLMSMTAFEKDGKTWVLGSTACTPVVRLDAADVADKKKVKSATIVELGMGNAPVTLVVYQKDRKDVLLVTSEEDTYRVDGAVLGEKEKLNEKAITRNKGEIEQVKVLAAWKGVSRVSLLDGTSAVAVKRGEKLSLETLDLP